MNRAPKARLSVLLVISHVLVALIALAAAAVLIYLLSPRLFSSGHGSVHNSGRGGGTGILRPEVLAALQQALIWGMLAGLIAALALGAIASRSILGPVHAVRRATRRIARGDYHAELPSPGTRELGELVDDVGTMAERLGGLEAQRTRLLGEIGHEMRTPLTVIDGQVEAMIDGVLPTSAENLAVIGTEARRLHRLAADLSALSKAEEGRVVLDRQVIELGAVVSQVTERLRPQTLDAEIELSVQADAGVRVLADADRLAQVVTNLVGNAIRATPAGGRITVSCRREADQGVVQVADTGEGLAALDLERVFERFYRVPGRRSSGRESGSGIGLTIARHLVEQHGGTLSAASEGKGRGATFTVRLPSS